MKPIVSENASRNTGACGIVLGVLMAYDTKKNARYYGLPSFKPEAASLARQIGVGFEWIVGATEKGSVTVGILVHGTAGDLNGRIIGFLRQANILFHQDTALFRPDLNAAWQIVNIERGKRNIHRTSIGCFSIENLDTLISIITSQQSREPVNTSSYFEITESALCSAKLLDMPTGWLGMWKASLLRRSLT